MANKITNQKVRVFGSDVVYQFSQTGNGSRTVKTGVYDVRTATQEELDNINNQARRSRASHSKNRTRKRGNPLDKNDDEFRTLIGEIKYNLAGSVRRAKVWGMVFLKYDNVPTIWETYEPIFEEI